MAYAYSSLLEVQEFHLKFGHLIAKGPSIPPEEIWKLRIKLLKEELRELEEDGFEAGNITEVFDALCDLQYVLDGAFLICGMHTIKDAGTREVHRSNMSKLNVDGKPIFREDGKILKGPYYEPPNLEIIINTCLESMAED